MPLYELICFLYNAFEIISWTYSERLDKFFVIVSWEEWAPVPNSIKAFDIIKAGLEFFHAFRKRKALFLLGYQFFLLSVGFCFLLYPVPLSRKDLSLKQDLLKRSIIRWRWRLILKIWTSLSKVVVNILCLESDFNKEGFDKSILLVELSLKNSLSS